MKDFADQVSEYGVVEKQPKMEARTMAMFVGPKSIIISQEENKNA